MPDEHDGDRTSPDLGAEEPTQVGANAFTAITDGMGRAVSAVRALAGAIPGRGSAGRRRGLELFSNALGIAGDLFHDSRRAVNALIREEFP